MQTPRGSADASLVELANLGYVVARWWTSGAQRTTRLRVLREEMVYARETTALWRRYDRVFSQTDEDLGMARYCEGQWFDMPNISDRYLQIGPSIGMSTRAYPVVKAPTHEPHALVEDSAE